MVVSDRGGAEAGDGPGAAHQQQRPSGAPVVPAGEGVCLKSRWDVGQDLASGRLVEILPEFAAPASRLQIVYPSGRHQPRRVRALIDALVAEFGRPAQG
nr:LysR substrate-binding domain-containing protein [Aeromonas schubertii]